MDNDIITEIVDNTSVEATEYPRYINKQIDDLQLPTRIVDDGNLHHNGVFGQAIPYELPFDFLFITRLVGLFLILSVCGWSILRIQLLVIKYTEKYDQLLYATYNNTFGDLIMEDEQRCFFMRSSVRDDFGVEKIFPPDIYQDSQKPPKINTTINAMTKVPSDSSCPYYDFIASTFTKFFCANDSTDDSIYDDLLEGAYSTSKATSDFESSFSDSENQCGLPLASALFAYFFEPSHPTMCMSDSPFYDTYD